MNLMEKLHGSTHDTNAHSGHSIPFWVRFYDPIVSLTTLGRTKKLHQATLSLAHLRPGDHVLEVGCGTGSLILEAEKLVGEHGTAVALDVEPAMIAQAQRKAARAGSAVTFQIAAIEAIPFPDASFDVTLSSAMMHHLRPSQKEQGVVELFRVLKPDGRLLVVDLNPSRQSIATTLPGHRRLPKQDYIRDILPDFLQAAGFRHIQTGIHPFSSYISYAIGEKS
jgi:ubiquinone/menaquinone biosynthesis C-methylase UbiE